MGEQQPTRDFQNSQQFVERRSTDLSSESTRTRLAVLEHKVDNFDSRMTDLEVSLRFANIKLDDKLRTDSETLRVMEGRLSTIGKAVELMAEKLDDTTDMASKARRIVDRHETIGATMLKIGSVITVMLTAIWAIFRYYVTF